MLFNSLLMLLGVIFRIKFNLCYSLYKGKNVLCRVLETWSVCERSPEQRGDSHDVEGTKWQISSVLLN